MFGADQPHYALDWPSIAQESAEAVRRREATLDKLIAARGEPAAHAELRIWRAIEDDWHFATHHDRRAGAPQASQGEMIGALEESLRRCTAQAKKAQDALPDWMLKDVPNHGVISFRALYGHRGAAYFGDRPDYAREAEAWLTAVRRRDLVDAMLWWAKKGDLDLTVRLTLQLRADANHRRAQPSMAA